MPKAIEENLKRRAKKLAKAGKLRKKKGETTKQAEDTYTYSVMRTMEKRHRAKGGAPGKYMKKV